MPSILKVAALVLLFHAPAARASHELGFGARSAELTSDLLFVNAPLPMLYYRKGDYKVTLQPAIFDGKLDYHDPGGFDQTGDFDGFGGGGGFSYALSDRWGVYLLGLGSALEGDFRYLQTSNCGAACSDTRMTGVRASFATVSAGLVRQFFGEGGRGFVLPVFIGPMVTRMRLRQTVQDATVYNVDFDMETTRFVPGLQAGVQAGIDVGAFKLNPFFILGFVFSDECKDIDSTTVRTDSGATGQPCNRPVTQVLTYKSENPLGGAGLNVLYKPWGLAMNVTAPLLKKGFLGAPDYPEVVLWSLSWSFGSYLK